MLVYCFVVHLNGRAGLLPLFELFLGNEARLKGHFLELLLVDFFKVGSDLLLFLGLDLSGPHIGSRDNVYLRL